MSTCNLTLLVSARRARGDLKHAKSALSEDVAFVLVPIAFSPPAHFILFLIYSVVLDYQRLSA